jgi:hypothetical protein
MTPEQPQDALAQAKDVLRTANLIAATKIFVDALHGQGVQSYVIGYALNEDPEGQGMTKIEGSATLILNLVASVVKGMRPADFKNLLAVMLAGDYFAEHREAIGLGKKQDTPKGHVN